MFERRTSRTAGKPGSFRLGLPSPWWSHTQIQIDGPFFPVIKMHFGAIKGARDEFDHTYPPSKQLHSHSVRLRCQPPSTLATHHCRYCRWRWCLKLSVSQLAGAGLAMAYLAQPLRSQLRKAKLQLSGEWSGRKLDVLGEVSQHLINAELRTAV